MSGGAPAEALKALQEALAGAPAWLVGGITRDRHSSRMTDDVDVVVQGSAQDAARAVARAAGGAACFELSADFCGWRVVARDRSWQVDVQALRGDSLEADLAMRDFTVNAIAEPIGGGASIDPLGGLEDLAAGRLRMAGAHAFEDDPLRALRLVRLSVELGMKADPDTLAAARRATPEIERVAGERVFMELRRIVSCERVLEGLALMDDLGLTAVVLPELDALHDVAQNRFHHLDVYSHTLEVLERVIALQRDPAATLGSSELGEEVAVLLGEPLADELTRGDALRWAALLHDAAKPLTREVGGDGRITFLGHDMRGAVLARSLLERLRASERTRAHVAALVRHHLRLGFLVHEPQPLARRTVFAYLQATSPVEADITLLSVADRLATRGDGAERSIDAHMRVARPMLADALRFKAEGPPAPLWRGDELAAALGIDTGPLVGQLLEELAAACYAGEIDTREQALARARVFLRSRQSESARG